MDWCGGFIDFVIVYYDLVFCGGDLLDGLAGVFV